MNLVCSNWCERTMVTCLIRLNDVNKPWSTACHCIIYYFINTGYRCLTPLHKMSLFLKSYRYYLHCLDNSSLFYYPTKKFAATIAWVTWKAECDLFVVLVIFVSNFSCYFAIFFSFSLCLCIVRTCNWI
jgi:hypothetical protein